MDGFFSDFGVRSAELLKDLESYPVGSEERKALMGEIEALNRCEVAHKQIEANSWDEQEKLELEKSKMQNDEASKTAARKQDLVKGLGVGALAMLGTILASVITGQVNLKIEDRRSDSIRRQAEQIMDFEKTGEYKSSEAWKTADKRIKG